VEVDNDFVGGLRRSAGDDVELVIFRVRIPAEPKGGRLRPADCFAVLVDNLGVRARGNVAFRGVNGRSRANDVDERGGTLAAAGAEIALQHLGLRTTASCHDRYS